MSRMNADRLKQVPGNSVRETGDRIKGGAVSEERSPENEAILNSDEHADTGNSKMMMNLRFEKRGPTSALSGWHCLYAMSDKEDGEDDVERQLTEGSESDMDVRLKAAGKLTYYYPLITCSYNLHLHNRQQLYVRYRRKEKEPWKTM